MLDAGTPPDLVLDLTKNGISSEAVKLLSLSLGLPTVSAAFGEEGDIRFAVIFLTNVRNCTRMLFFGRQWIDLTDEQQKYLIQVRPPGDLFPDILRDLAIANNITNAAILYDTSFGVFLNFNILK